MAGLSQPGVRGAPRGTEGQVQGVVTSSVWRAQAQSEKGLEVTLSLPSKTKHTLEKPLLALSTGSVAASREAKLSVSVFPAVSRVSPLIPDQGFPDLSRATCPEPCLPVPEGQSALLGSICWGR